MSTITELKLLPNSGIYGGSERPIDRNFLVDIAPDRESQVRGAANIVALREVIKLSGEGQDSDFWLNRSQRKERVIIRNVPKSLSDLDWKLPSPAVVKQTIQKLLDSQTFSGQGSYVSLSDTNSLRLSTDDIMVSPRALGPTHILIAFTERISASGVVCTDIAEIPICDLVFTAHCPNLLLALGEGGEGRLPYRRQSDLPVVSLSVAHVATFPALVAYMHTRDTTTLLRALMPAWIVDVIQPLMKKTLLARLGAQQTWGKVMATSFLVTESIAATLAKRIDYNVAAKVGTAVTGLKDNLEAVGLKEPLLDAEIDLVFRIFTYAVNILSLELVKKLPASEVILDDSSGSTLHAPAARQ